MKGHESDENAARSDLFAGRFQILEKLGDGATGDVFKVTDSVLNRQAAIKLLRFRNEERKILRFQREAKASSKLKHPGLIEVYDFGIADDGTPYLVMELIEGNSLESVLKNIEKMDTDRALRIASLTAEAMQHAHAHKVVHRDLKPSNIMIVNEGKKEQVKVLDFGLAAILEDDGVARTLTPNSLGFAGTPYFMSPEQASKTGVDERADVYSLGCILFSLIAGRPPFIGESTMQTVELHKTAEVPNLRELVADGKISTILIKTIEKMLAKNPAQRFQNMTEVKSALDACRSDANPSDANPSDALFEQSQKEKAPSKDSRRLKFVPIAIVSAAAVMIGVIACYFAAPLMVQSSDPKNTVKMAKTSGILDPLAASDDLKVDFNMAASVAGDNSGDIALSPSMQLNGEGIDDLTIENILIGNPNLEKIMISDARVTDKCTALMVNSNKLFGIHLEYCPNITNAALLPFKRIKHLETLNLRGSTGITDQGMDTLAACKSLNQILLGNNKNITVRGVEKLAGIPKLFHLGLGDTGVRGKDFLVLKKLPRLVYLSMDHCKLDQSDVDAIAELKFLKAFSMTSSSISDKGLMKLAELPNLEVLKMASSDGHSLLSVTRLKQKIGRRCLVETEQPYRGVFSLKR